MFLTKEQILATSAKNMTIVSFEVPSLGGSVLLKPLTIGEKNKWQASMFTQKGEMDFSKAGVSNVELAAISIVDETGTRLFQAAELDALPAAAIDPIISEIQRINGMRVDAVKDAKKNSDQNQNDTTSSS